MTTESSDGFSNYGDFTKPHLAALLRLLGLDYEIIRAEGNQITAQFSDGKQKQVTDFVGGYGSNLLGHNFLKIKTAAQNFFKSGRTAQAQLSIRGQSGRLSRELCRLAQEETGQEFIATLGNTGAEAVEMTLHHARLQWQNNLQQEIQKGKQVFQKAKTQVLLHQKDSESYSFLTQKQEEWQDDLNEKVSLQKAILISLENSYHGKTLAARKASDFQINLNNSEVHFFDVKDENFNDKPSFHFEYKFPYFEKGKIQWKTKRQSRVYALIAEPLQGEGGVRLLTEKQAENLRQWANRLGCPLIWDEIQSGSYRTGRLFYSTKLGASGDYCCLGKALGGGAAKLSAVLVRKPMYLPAFDLLHPSTFAEDDFSAEVGLAFLSQRKLIQNSVKGLAPHFEKELKKLAADFPKIIKESRGAGLIWGLEFNTLHQSGSYVLQALSRSGFFNYLLAAWLCRERNIRCSAPLSQAFVLRFHADVACSEKDVAHLSKSLKQLCQIIENQDVYQLIKFALPEKWRNLRSALPNFAVADLQLPERPQVGFLTHYISCDSIRQTDPSLAVLPDEALHFLLEKFLPFLPPVITGGRSVEAAGGQRADLVLVGLAFTSEMARQAMTERHLTDYRQKVQEAVKLAEGFDCEVVGLGQFTSILSQNGKSLTTQKAVLTTGNGLTVFLTAEALRLKAQDHGLQLKDEKVALVGGLGNIGQTLYQLLHPECKEIVICSNPKNQQKNLEDNSIKTRYDFKELAHYKIVLICTNSPECFINQKNTHPKALIGDISVPKNISKDLIENPDERDIFETGLARFPDGKGIPARGIPLGKDQVFGCLAETLTLWFSKQYHLTSLGKLKTEKIEALGKIAEELGFAPYIRPNYEVLEKI